MRLRARRELKRRKLYSVSRRMRYRRSSNRVRVSMVRRKRETIRWNRWLILNHVCRGFRHWRVSLILKETELLIAGFINLKNKTMKLRMKTRYNWPLS
jgi:hypothetical protein